MINTECSIIRYEQKLLLFFCCGCKLAGQQHKFFVLLVFSVFSLQSTLALILTFLLRSNPWVIFMCQAPTNIILKFLLMLCKHQIADKIKVKARKRWCRCLLNNLNLALGMRKLLIIISVHNWTRIKNWDSVNITRTTLMRNIYVGLVESNCSSSRTNLKFTLLKHKMAMS